VSTHNHNPASGKSRVALAMLAAAALLLGIPGALAQREAPLAGGPATRPAATAEAQAAEPQSRQQETLVRRYCVGCHNEQLRTGGASFERLDFSDIGENAALWEKARRKVRAGEMPPPGAARPEEPALAAFTGWLADSLDEYAAAHPNPGRPAVHRLNRAEYANVARDLLAVEIGAEEQLPADDSGYGFDNIADLLSVSPALLERYLAVARRVSRAAVGDLSMKPVTEEFDAPGGSLASGRVSDDLPFLSRGGLSVRYRFPVDADYVFTIKLRGEGGRHEIRAPVQAGQRAVGAAFPRVSAKFELTAPETRGADEKAGVETTAPMDVRLDGARIRLIDVSAAGGAPQLDSITIAGPYETSGRGRTPSREKIFVCYPEAAAGEEPCAREILSSLARRAYRRAATNADVRPLLGFYRRARREGDFDSGIEAALRAMLVSPSFLFRVERDPDGAARGSVHRIGGPELASRLSFFLWSSMPDDELLGLAEEGKLHDAAVFEQQARRMIEDPRSRALVDNFAGQWLQLRNVRAAKPDPAAFPRWDEGLRQAFLRETELFFETMLRENRPATELIDAGFTFLNERLALYYGVRGFYGSQFRRVEVGDETRGGLLTQGSILTATSYPNRTSIVQRGKWILENLLGSPPPPPPPDIPELKIESESGKRSVREAMELHRANAACATCHARMDPLGFALENYDGIGAWRLEDAGSPIDATGRLPDGTEIDGPTGLKQALLGRRDEFVEAFVERLLTYALGRGVEHYDRPAIRAIMRETAPGGYRMQDVMIAVAQSAPFQMRRTPE
jgi:cytochrome c553